MLASLSYAKPLQIEEELKGLVQVLLENGVKSYLEIGSRYGGSFERIMTALPAGSRGLSVDFPGDVFGDNGSVPILLAALERLRAFGSDVDCIFGPSQAPEVIERVRRHAPFDAVMIDADHRYEAVKRDFEIYALMGRIVVLHDVAAPDWQTSKTGVPVEVPRFWHEIKGLYRNLEIVAPDSNMGVGVLFR